jgi:lipid A ethanolaminephosphotransferase
MKKFISDKRFKIPHTYFCAAYTILLYAIYNVLNFDKIAKWFYVKDKIDYSGLVAFLIIGLCASIAVFTLLFHRRTTKPLVIIFVILGAVSTYFTAKYNVVIDRTMIMNAVNTDVSEVRSLLSFQMIPYVIFLMALPILATLFVQITFEPAPKYLLSSLKLCVLALVIGIGLLYMKFDSVHRASNLSKKYILHTLIPLNYFQSIGSIVQQSATPYFAKHKKNVEISGRIILQDDLVVVLAIGETSRQQNFSLYGYKRQNTNPVLSKEKNLHLLNGIARVGSTLYALPEILVKHGVPLVAITSKFGINTSCYVNYTLYDNCASVGEAKVKNCGHNGVCYDEDVVPLLDDNLKSYNSGYRLIVLHLGGGSHGPSYNERYPQEFQRFQPMCHDADVVNQCTTEQLYNSYDNTILYVDHVVGKIINTLDKSKKPYVLIYLSDHGESLMEEGRIFHGMPPGIKLPPEQAHIPLIVKSSIPISITKRQEYGQQDVFDSILDLFSIETSVHDKNKSFIKKRNEKN